MASALCQVLLKTLVILFSLLNILFSELYKTFNPSQDLETESIGRSGKGDSIPKSKRKVTGKKRPTTNKANSRSKNVNGHRRKMKNSFGSIFADKITDASVDSIADVDVDKTLSTVFSSLHNIQNQIGFKRQDELALNMAKLKQVSDTLGHCKDYKHSFRHQYAKEITINL